jgi:prepilin-type N-terminal cleavage/methylation domain-containing protein
MQKGVFRLQSKSQNVFSDGFTVVELLVVMVIISIILGISIPRLSRTTIGTKLKTTTDSIEGLLETAKSFASAQNTSCAAFFDATENTVSLIKRDIDDVDNDTDTNEFIEFDRGLTIPSGITVYFTADNRVQFSAYGSVENPDDDIRVTAASINKQRIITINQNTGYIQVS